MKRILIIGDSGGIGHAVAEEWRSQGAEVTGLSRSRDGLDVTDEASVERVLGGLEPAFDVVFVATGALEINGAKPEKTLRTVTGTALMDQFALNAMGPMLVLKHALRLLPRRDDAVFAALSARVGSIGDNRLGGWYSYRAAKAALNQLIHGAAVELARGHKNLACVTLHPGTVATRFTADYQATHPTVSPQDAAQNLVRVMSGLGPEQTGQFLDYAGKEIPW